MLTILGGGPSGVSLAVMLCEVENIILIERENTLGGIWRTEWKNNLFTEHSPHVISKEYHLFFKMCKKINVTPKLSLYKKTYELDMITSPYFIFGLPFLDKLKFIYSILKSRFKSYENTSILDYSKQLSSKGQKILYIVSVLLATTPDKFLVQDLFDLMLSLSLKTFVLSNAEEIFNKAEKYLISKNVKIRKDYEVTSLFYQNSQFLINNDIISPKCIISVCPQAFLKILQNSSPILQNNWMPYSKLQTLIKQSTYVSIGFQLHWNSHIPLAVDYCKYCAGEWNIIIIPSSKHLDTFTKHSSIKTVWSCTIIDQDNYSSFLKKKVYQCSFNEIKNEVIRQLNVPNPTFFTFSNDIKKVNQQYVSKDSGFMSHKYGIVPSSGKLENIHLVGPITEKGVIIMESGIQSAANFVSNHYPGNEFKTQNYNFIILLTIICIISYYFLIKRN